MALHDVATGAREVSCLRNSLRYQEILEKCHSFKVFMVID